MSVIGIEESVGDLVVVEVHECCIHMGVQINNKGDEIML